MSLRVMYGGTFDPVHAGHIAVAQQARDVLKAEVILLPAGDPPHKGPTQASAQQRVAMCDLAIAGIPGLRVDPREAMRDTPSWTYDTLLSLRADIGPDAPVALLIGADSFLSLPTWKSWRALFDLAHFVVAERPGNALHSESWSDELRAEALDRIIRVDGKPDAKDIEVLHQQPAGRILMMNQPVFPHSSSEIRAHIAAGGTWENWVDPKVAAFIQRTHLYRAS
ncbi:nicotinate-nucleotide adenylyltransferase [Lysobacter sp. HDW10]|uniref:nicotinate-nucleotide adenylyltransferase n=1 Tax=Lysobacter sp. HDW10 TaxID=2714936 RepID=UPI00140C74FC|nr:nicotinate-nucleotide adenylyltransferase [Lysobacter sp. HDW10]QIK81302.1 nicotinate-nucleotide adenylyltransferase [Lysobacter sp. HDW10]